MDRLLDQPHRFGGQRCALRIVLQVVLLDAGPMHQEHIVQYLEVVIQGAERIALRHFVAATLPAEALIVMRIGMRANEDWLPVVELAVAFAHLEDAQLCGSELDT